MADNILLNKETVAGGQTIATEDIGGIQHEKVLVEWSDGAGGANITSAANPLPVTVSGGITSSENLAQVNGATVNVGTGAAGTGTQRVAVASDSTLATVSTVTTVSSVTQNADVRQATAANLNATVVQGTGSNLHTVVDSGTITTVGTVTTITNQVDENIKQVGGNNVATAASGTQKVGIVGNAAATVDATIGAGTAPTNMIAVGGVYNLSEISPTTGQSAAIQLDAHGRQRMVMMDGQGNPFPARVNSAGQLSVTVDSFTPSGTQNVNVAQINGATIATGASGLQKVGVVGNAGAIVDGVNTAATAPANGILGLGIYNLVEPSPTTGQSVGIQLDLHGRQRQVIMDGAGNTRAANVDSNSNLGVVLATETTKVIGTVRNLGNAGAIFDGVIGAATAPANMVVSGGVYNLPEVSLTSGQSAATQLDLHGRTRQVIMDGAGNTRAANVDANSNLGVVLATETTKVIGTTRTLGNTGATLDAAVGAGTAPTNMLAVGGIYNLVEPTPTSGQSVALQLDKNGRQRISIMDGAGNTRAANVNASGQLSVSVDAMLATTQNVNVAQIGGATIATGATGLQKVGIVGNAGGIFDAVIGAGTAPANMVVGGGVYNLPEISLTNGQSSAAQFDFHGRQKMSIWDGQGNSRPAYVNANNQLSVSVDNTASVPVRSVMAYNRSATTVMVVTNLNSLGSSATAGWQSARVSNVSTLASDYLINVKLTTQNTAPASDKAAYVYIDPWYFDGVTWYSASGGTTTLPSGSEGTYTIASPNNLRLLGVLNYTTAQQLLTDTFLLSNCFGNRLPDGFSIVIINFTGSSIANTGNIVQYLSIADTLT